MDDFIGLIKQEALAHVRLDGEFLYADNDELEQKYENFSKNFKENYIRLDSYEKDTYSLIVNIPTNDKFNFESFNKMVSFIEQNLPDQKMDFLNRVVLHYSTKEYMADPQLPIELEHKSDIGSIQLCGVRVAFPNSKEFETVIMDVQNCDHCGTEALNVQIISKEKSSFSVKYIILVVGKAVEFSKNFV